LFLISVRNRSRRNYSASTASPQRPCTAASHSSKSRPESSGVHIDVPQKEQQEGTEEEAEIVRLIYLFIFSIENCFNLGKSFIIIIRKYC
jgi:hypothetical protein